MRSRPGRWGNAFGIAVGDELASLNGRGAPRRHRVPDARRRGAPSTSRSIAAGIALELSVEKEAGEPLGLEVSSALFDRIRTCDNHCAFCFIYQLPKGMRKSLYVKDDDYRLSFLYGNFTTLTRFTELDLERVVTERLGPLYVSIHATDPEVRAQMLRNRRARPACAGCGPLLDAGIEVHGQIVVCPGVNDGDASTTPSPGSWSDFPSSPTAAAVPLGVSRFSNEPRCDPTPWRRPSACSTRSAELAGPLQKALGRPLSMRRMSTTCSPGATFTGRGYDGYPQHENGIGMARAFIDAFARPAAGGPGGVRHGFFASVDAAPAEGYRAVRLPTVAAGVDDRPVTVLTGTYGARVLGPLLASHPRRDVHLHAIANDFFGGNIGVAGLLTGEDVARP